MHTTSHSIDHSSPALADLPHSIRSLLIHHAGRLLDLHNTVEQLRSTLGERYVWEYLRGTTGQAALAARQAALARIDDVCQRIDDGRAKFAHSSDDLRSALAADGWSDSSVLELRGEWAS